MKQTGNYRFSNWAGNYSCVSGNYFQPENEAEIIEAVTDCKKARLVGTGHSWSAICLNEEALINLDHYNKVLSIDKDKLQIKVQAGIKLWQLNSYLDQC